MTTTRKATIFILAGLALVFAGLSVYIAVKLIGDQAPYDSSVADGDSCNFALYGVNDPACQPAGICCFCNKCGGDPATCNTTCGITTSSATSSASPAYACEAVTLSQDIVLPGSTITIVASIAENLVSNQALLFLLDDAGQQAAVSDLPTTALDENTLGIFNYTFDFSVPSDMPLGVYAVRFSHSGTINDLVIEPAECAVVLTVSNQVPSTTSSTTSSTPPSSTSTPVTSTPSSTSEAPAAPAPVNLPDTGLFDEPLIPLVAGLLLLLIGVVWLRSGFTLRIDAVLSAFVTTIPGYKTLAESRSEFEDRFEQD